MPSLNRPPKMSLALALVFLLSLAAGCAPGLGYAGPVDECGPIEPSQQDVQYVLKFASEPFNQPDWEKSYTVDPYRVTLTRKNNRENAVAYMEYLMFNCGYGQTELDEYFGEEGFGIVFANYESYGLYNFCEVGNLALYEYSLENEGESYAARYWVQQSSDTRLLVVMLVFPLETMSLMNGYAKQIFPDLVACGNQ